MYYNLPILLLTKLFIASRELKQTIAKIGSIQVRNSLKNPAKKRDLKKEGLSIVTTRKGLVQIIRKVKQRTNEESL